MSRGRARLAIGEGLSVWVLEAPDGFGEPAFHAHHAIQISACLSGALAVTDEEGTLSAPIVAVAADVRHRFEAHGLSAFIFVEPESRAGRALGQSLFAERALVEIEGGTPMRIVGELNSALDGGMTDEALLGVGRDLLNALVPGTEARMPDERIQRIIAYAGAHLDEPLSLESASKGVYLSPSRLRHLFVEQTGLAFKTYVLWLRLVRAVQLYAQGQSLTEAAHLAGFSDSAHFSRIFKRTFGLPATTLTRL